MTLEDYAEGISAEELFVPGEGITFDDFVMYPGVIDFAFEEISIKTRLFNDYSLNFGVTSSPMDTVTEEEAAIAIALEGGMGVIHCNNTVKKQKAMVEKAKILQSRPFRSRRVVERQVLEYDLPVAWHRQWHGLRWCIDVRTGVQQFYQTLTSTRGALQLAPNLAQACGRDAEDNRV